ncbi:MAG: response regulator [Clostridium sp.]|nr:MAG: response regulator [Clostridium sp.]
MKKETIDFDLTNKKILVVDDNELNLEIIEFMLSTLNCKNFLKASSANEAINIYKASNENEIDLIFDGYLNAKKIDGVTATKTIRLIDRKDAKKIKIIAMSANTFDDDISDALKSGMNDYISKPIDRDNLMKIIKKRI